MSENSVVDYSSTCARLAQVLQDLNVDIRVSEQNQKLKDTYTEQLRRHDKNIMLCNQVIEEMKPLIDDTEEYINARRVESMQNINNALRMAGEIVPDAETNISIKLDGDEAWIVTPDERTAQNTEGGAFRHISSTFLKAVMLGSNPNYLRTIMLDEMFAQVNAENTAKLSLYLSVLSQDMQVICIEQKPEIKSNIDTLVYHFKKGEEYAEVTKSFLKAGLSIGEDEEGGEQIGS